MLGRKLGRKVGMAVMATGLLTGMLGVVGLTAAHAGTSNQFYVQPAGDGGNDNGGANTCELITKPCATIAHAIAEEASLTPNSPGSVITLLKGTYNAPACTATNVPAGCDNMFAGLGPNNSDVTITGTTNKKGVLSTTVEPQAGGPTPGSCAALGTVSGDDAPYNGAAGDNGFQAMVVFDAPSGSSINGVTVENMNLNGADVAGGACPAYQAGVLATGETLGDAVVGVALQSGTTYGILTDDNANSTEISNVLTPVLCSTVVTGPNTGLNAGWTTPANLKVKALPKCAKFKESGHGAANGVFINGIAYCTTTSASKLVLVITGTPNAASGCTAGGTPITHSGGLEIATGATVTYNTSTAPFTQWGIACNSPLVTEDQTTDCAISDNTVTAGGTVLGDYPAPGDFPPVGILVTGGAVADVDGNTVSGVADNVVVSSTKTNNDGIGIGLLPDAIDGCSAGENAAVVGPPARPAEYTVVGVNDINNPNTGHGNTLSSNDVGIAVAGNTGTGCSDNNPGYEVNSNTVSSGNQAGIALDNLGYGGAHLQTPLQSNSISGVTEGVGIEAEGVTGQTIGGPLASEGNTETGSGIGLVLAPCVGVSKGGTCSSLYDSIPAEPSDANLIQNNSFTGNIAYGVLTVGGYQVNELANQIPIAGAALWSVGNTFNANQWGTATSATNGTLPSEINGSEVEDGSGWGGGCVSEAGDCPISSLTYEGANQTLGASNPGTGTLTLSVCDATTSQSENLPAGTEITFDTQGNTAGETNDGGTFYVTQAAIITGDTSCLNPNQYANITVQAIAPARVGTLNAPAGQNYILGTGDTVYVNANGTASSALNIYGTSAAANSCTPVDTAHNTADVFGETDPPFTQYSTTLQASTGGVNATYAAC